MCCRKAEELRCEERRTRIRLGESLEALRPTLSARGKQAPADATPTLYDTVSRAGLVSCSSDRSGSGSGSSSSGLIPVLNLRDTVVGFILLSC